MKILVFGNLLVEKDNLALKLIPKLREEFPEIAFKELDPTEDLHSEGRNLRIIDVAEGIKEVIVLEDINNLEIIKSVSMHDFDLAYNLKLLDKIDKLDKVEIICIPIGLDFDSAFDQIQLILRKWVAQDIQGS